MAFPTIEMGALVLERELWSMSWGVNQKWKMLPH
jgi:hypothetical protein